MDVIMDRIYLNERHYPQYCVALRPYSISEIIPTSLPAEPAPIVVAVYEYRGASMVPNTAKYRYDFVGVRVQ